jgi:hypothetical protein
MSDINKPHENDEDPADFFGDGDDDLALPTIEPADAPAPASGEVTEGQTLIAGDEIAEVGASIGDIPAKGPVAPPEDDEPKAEEPKAAEEPPEPESIGQAAARAAGEKGEETRDEAIARYQKDAETQPEPAKPEKAEKKRGRRSSGQTSEVTNGPRGYVVIREIELTREFIDVFVKELDAGKDPRKIYMVLQSRVEARNPAPVLLQAFRKYAKQLGQPMRLAAIPESMWKIKTLAVKPRVIEDNIEIEDGGRAHAGRRVTLAAGAIYEEAFGGRFLDTRFLGIRELGERRAVRLERCGAWLKPVGQPGLSRRLGLRHTEEGTHRDRLFPGAECQRRHGLELARGSRNGART